MSRFRLRIVSNNNIRDDNYLNFTAVSDLPTIIQRGGENTEAVYYTLDNPELNNWIEFNSSSNITLNLYSIIYFKGNIGEQDEIDRANEYMLFLLSGGNVEAHGDIMSIAYNRTLTKNYLFKKLFEQCINLITAPELTATTLTEGCYYGMFSNCTSLIKAPELKASIVPIRAYFGMFYKCSSLEETPNLSAVELSISSYLKMFEGCSSLIKISNLPAEIVPDYAYSNMFKNCSSLKDIDILMLATLIGQHGCEYMFSLCFNLENILKLNATTILDYCYFNTFSDCILLKNLTNYILPAEVLAPYCYANMFSRCSNLKTTPELPSTTLAEGCYLEMFLDCINLTESPKLPSTILAEKCYYKMFLGCINLKHVEALFESVENINSIKDWLKDSYITGTILKTSSSQWLDSEIVPDGWNSKFADEYLSFVSEMDGTRFGFNNSGLSYSIDGGKTWNILLKDEYTPPINDGQEILLKGELLPTDNGIGSFNSIGIYFAKGNIMSLIYGDNFKDKFNLTGKDYVFKNLFESNFITSVKNLLMPATTLSKGCYYGMFDNCLNLRDTPKLLAKVLTESCYESMFLYCNKLETINELNFTTTAKNCCKNMFKSCRRNLKNISISLNAEILEEGCYNSMFSYCTSLQNPPSINAKVLAKECCAYMFQTCVNLLYSPFLLSKTLTTECYKGMFLDCSKLLKIETLFTTEPSDLYTEDWVSGVNDFGVFIKSSEANWNVVGNNGIPETWEVKRNNSEYLTFTTIENSHFKFIGNDIEYSLDNGNTWLILADNTYSPEIIKGNSILWRGELLPKQIIKYILDLNNPDTDLAVLNSGIGTFSSTGEFSVSGNILSLIYKNNFNNNLNLLLNFVFYKLFYGCNKLKSAKNLILPSSLLSIGCYYKMFSECSSLTDCPELPAVTLADHCYFGMFLGCTSLKNIPSILPAKELKNFCYKKMFLNCESLETIPKLGNKLSVYCFLEMFRGCKSLTEVIWDESFENDFSDVAAEGCYIGMFLECINLKGVYDSTGTRISLKKKPSFSCYFRMFKDCRSLIISPEILCTESASLFCMQMFENCTNLEKVPNILLPNLLHYRCYYLMFKGCSKLKNSPQINAVNFLKEGACEEMFMNCTSLNNIKALFSLFSDSNTKNWVYNVSNHGIFIKNDFTLELYGDSSIPSNWEIIDNSKYKEGTLIFNITKIGTVTIKSTSNLINKNINYSIDGGNTWNTVKISTKELNIERQLNVGELLLIKGDNNLCAFNDGQNILYINFGGTAEVNISGNIMSLINNETEIDNDYAFYKLFDSYSNLLYCGELQFPNSVSNYCYSHMFNNCENLILGPTILPAKNLKIGCYEYMFSNSKLILAPILPATNLVEYCYSHMFNNCTLLKYLNVAFTSWNKLCTLNWVHGVTNDYYGITTNSGSFYKNILLPKIEGSDYIPKDWYIENNNNTPLCFKFKTTGHLKINFTGESSKEGETVEWKIDDDVSPKLWLEYSLNKGLSWINVTKTVEETDSSDEIWIRGLGGNFNEEHNINGDPNYWKDYWISFIPDSECSIGGNILLVSNMTKIYNSEGNVERYLDLSQWTNYIGDYKCAHMFDGASNIVDAHELILVGDEIGKYTCMSMFKDCTGLNNPPKLSATKLSTGCYANMFSGCTNLTTAPELPAINIPSFAYYEMFKGCTNLNHIKAMFTTTPSTNQYISNTVNWVEDVSLTGTFVKNSAATWNTTGNNGVPNGWTIETANS